MTREERAERLRPIIREAVRGTSLRQVAKEAGVSHTALHNLLEKDEVPYDRTLHKLEVWVDRRGSVAVPMLREVAPNYQSLGIDLPGYDRLLERPRAAFDSFMLELIRRGLPREDLEEIGTGVLGPIAAVNTLYKDRHEADTATEEAQLQVLNALIPVTLKFVEHRGK
jgi:AcrR family transcriptional regulator